MTTHILQGTNQIRWDVWPPSNGINSEYACHSPIITIPTAKDVLYMDCVLYDSHKVNNLFSDCQVYIVQHSDGGHELQETRYQTNGDFYAAHNSGNNPFITAIGEPILKNGGAWSAGDNFEIVFCWRGSSNQVVGIKSIRIY